MNSTTDEDNLFPATERAQTQMPAVALLARLGFQVLTRREARAARGGRTGRVLLDSILLPHLARANRVRYRGQEHPFTDAALRRAVQALADVPLAEGTQRAGELTYDLLRLGTTLDQTFPTPNGGTDTKSFTCRYIDWDHPENNVYHVTTEYAVRRAGTDRDDFLDIVLFVNGIPFVVIETKDSAVPLDQAIEVLRGYQRLEHVPHLFKTVQILIASNRQETKYATVGTDPKFWSVWRNRLDPDAMEDTLEGLLRRPLPPAQARAIQANFVRESATLYQAERDGRAVSAQDRLLYELCRPERLLELSSRFLLYDGGEKKIARYQQYEAVHQTMRRVQGRRGGPDSPRQGGLIWHTQGSGKSLTMVLLAQALATDPRIAEPRVVLVTDRVDLDKQIAGTFRRCGLDPQRAATGADLRRLVQDGRVSVITTLIQKFQAVSNTGEAADPSTDIFVLVDESHRSNYSTMAAAMRRVFPQACYIGFTGTPLLRQERDRSTLGKFGGLIEPSYPMQVAVADGAVVPLLYERRHVVQDVNEGPLDNWFERKTAPLTDEQRGDLKQKYSRKEPILRTRQRLETIVHDVAEHYAAHWQNAGEWRGYYKAQLVAPDKQSALLLHDFLQQDGRVTSEVIISPPDEREGDEEEDESGAAKVCKFWDKMMQKYGSEARYNESVISGFNSSDGPEILIVVDKLLTGFDVPRNTVLYLARPLKEHTLLQAIARVNRLYSGKDFGFILDYCGVLGELDQALTAYAALAGYDPKDVEGAIMSIRDALQQLPQAHADLLRLFLPIRNKGDEEEYEQFLGEEAHRREFYDRLADFSRCLKIALASETFLDETSPREVRRYKEALKRFQKLRAAVRLRYAESVNYGDLEPQILRLLDTYVFSDSVEVLTEKPVDIFDQVAIAKLLDSDRTLASQADLIASATARTITERMDQDPAFYQRFSELIRATIQQFRDHLLSEKEYLQRARELRDQVIAHGRGDLPVALRDAGPTAQAIYRSAWERLPQIATDPENANAAVQLALHIDAAIRRHRVVDWSRKLDVQNRMLQDINDVFYDLARQGQLTLDWNTLDPLAEEALNVAKAQLA